MGFRFTSDQILAIVIALVGLVGSVLFSGVLNQEARIGLGLDSPKSPSPQSTSSSSPSLSEFANLPEEIPSQPLIDSPTPVDTLETELGIDYSRLQKILSEKERDWQSNADDETVSVLIKAAGRFERKPLQEAEIINIPCKDLRTINDIWLKNSDGRFGFSVQNKIWRDITGSNNPSWKTRTEFGSKVGWFDGERPVSRKFIFSRDMERPGKLPRLAEGWNISTQFEPIWQQLDRCDIR